MPVQVTDEMRVAVFKDITERLDLPMSDEARLGAEEAVFTLAETAGLIPPRLTDEEKLAGKTHFSWTKEEQQLIESLRPYLSADDEGIPFNERIRLIADRVADDQP